MLYQRYKEIEFIKEMEIEESLSFFDFLYEKKTEEMIWERWLHHQEIAFEEFRSKLTPKPQKDDEEILCEVKDVLQLFSKERRGLINE